MPVYQTFVTINAMHDLIISFDKRVEIRRERDQHRRGKKGDGRNGSGRRIEVSGSESTEQEEHLRCAEGEDH